MELKISSPCPKSWDDLVGDDRIRYCGECRLNVYNLADMPQAEVEALVRSTQGRLCGRLYLRGDQTATTRDCSGFRTRQLLRRWLTAAGIFVLVAFTWISRSSEGPDRKILPNWAQAVLNVIDPPRNCNRQAVVGALPPPPRRPPVPPYGPNGS